MQPGMDLGNSPSKSLPWISVCLSDLGANMLGMTGLRTVHPRSRYAAEVLELGILKGWSHTAICGASH